MLVITITARNILDVETIYKCEDSCGPCFKIYQYLDEGNFWNTWDTPPNLGGHSNKTDQN